MDHQSNSPLKSPNFTKVIIELSKMTFLLDKLTN